MSINSVNNRLWNILLLPLLSSELYLIHMKYKRPKCGTNEGTIWVWVLIGYCQSFPLTWKPPMHAGQSQLDHLPSNRWRKIVESSTQKLIGNPIPLTTYLDGQSRWTLCLLIGISDKMWNNQRVVTFRYETIRKWLLLCFQCSNNPPKWKIWNSAY